MSKFTVTGTDLKIKGQIYREGSTVELSASDTAGIEKYLAPVTEAAGTKASSKTEPSKNEGTSDAKSDPSSATGNTGDKQ